MRLPRIRGDRPVLPLLDTSQARATPHTRGSTCVAVLIRDRAHGYPAYAGIDLQISPAPILRLWLPRIRGDRPGSGAFWQSRGMATPHTRGSTWQESKLSLSWKGYPAYAGIDLVMMWSVGPWERLPRIRGDRPKQYDPSAWWYPATPHTRGSTHTGRQLPYARGGYPAYAGIDLSSSYIPPTFFWLPRIRGDRPAPA